MEIQKLDLFSMPVFEVSVPEMEPYNEDMIKLFEGKIESGDLKPHQFGYGYQTPINLLAPQAYPGQPYFREKLAPLFNQACQSILTKAAHVDWAPNINYQWVNTLTIAWAVIQTEQTWGQESPWHTHLPSTLSGCYYVNLPENEDEGNFVLMNPTANNIFQPHTIQLRPKPGHFIIFPSFLKHRPTMSPSPKSHIRLTLCFDSHWTVKIIPRTPNSPPAGRVKLN